MFEGKKLLIVTKHGKDKVLKPIFEQNFNMEVIETPEIDTDLFGTFSGKIQRQKNLIETAKDKCVYAMQHFEADFYLSSEGSFGKNPDYPFAFVNEELIYLTDKSGQNVFSSSSISLDTNFNGQIITTLKEAEDFVKLVDFPSHALVLRKTKKDTEVVYSGIKNPKHLVLINDLLLTLNETYYIETDMRACYNPRRMKHIEETALKLVEDLKKNVQSVSTQILEL